MSRAKLIDQLNLGNSNTLAVIQKLVQKIINSLREEINILVGSPIPWPLPYFSVKAVNYSTGAEWLADSNFIGVSRPRNMAFNYIVRAA
ncbi:hypothetical protein [Photorhabdus temperata]|uniref:Uncharacterized protein n=1 Tax=Photorhabdus temperata subsp. temperata Meg1 TaxID=1393735 RepID=A0A081RSP9_PHOTE|nr:hypothetical protein [Photorhabdus temperata]KER01702.1 hypothetical protein MEG1DRAFT_03658 [Photorhabdus temperata subsp. temperata Meg1]